jgi:uncharacterized membrane protein YoaK (UPF0700 family)
VARAPAKGPRPKGTRPSAAADKSISVMFQHQGPSRSDRQNRVLAGYLAFVGGFVNSTGYVLIGSFTSHVTGNIGRLANDVAYRHYDAAATVLPMIVAFFAGAFVASMAIESDFFGRTANAYAVALLTEAALLVLFTAVSLSLVPRPPIKDAEAAILCAAMGMQNSLVTRLSGAVVRTTHLTGVVTDLGIEAARWFRWWRGTLAERLGVKLSFGRNPPERPSWLKFALLGTIAVTFTAGAMAGALVVVRLQHSTMLLPSAAVLACAAYALFSGRNDAGRPAEHGPTKERGLR